MYFRGSAELKHPCSVGSFAWFFSLTFFSSVFSRSSSTLFAARHFVSWLLLPKQQGKEDEWMGLIEIPEHARFGLAFAENQGTFLKAKDLSA